MPFGVAVAVVSLRLLVISRSYAQEIRERWTRFRLAAANLISPSPKDTAASAAAIAPAETAASPAPAATPNRTTVLDGYVHTAPCRENAINIFRGEWSSKLPPPLDVSTGPSELFTDARITWALGLIGGAIGLNVLELGPLEAGHTTMLERAGAASVVAVEGNARAFLKCLVVKEVLGLERSTFLCGDLIEDLRSDAGPFDLCVASGVLYHLRDPAEALHLMSGIADRLLLWTHYYDDVLVNADPLISVKFGDRTTAEIAGVEYALHRYEYGKALDWQGFSGGSSDFSNWMSREDILACLRAFGYNSIDIAFDHQNHPNGPAFAVLAQRH